MVMNKTSMPIAKKRMLKAIKMAMVLGNLNRTHNLVINGSVIKNRNKENTNGTKTVFMKNKAVVMPSTHKITKLVGIIDDLIWFIDYIV